MDKMDQIDEIQLSEMTAQLRQQTILMMMEELEKSHREGEKTGTEIVTSDR